jgi:hypothetical protein
MCSRPVITSLVAAEVEAEAAVVVLVVVVVEVEDVVVVVVSAAAIDDPADNFAGTEDAPGNADLVAAVVFLLPQSPNIDIVKREEASRPTILAKDVSALTAFFTSFSGDSA